MSLRATAQGVWSYVLEALVLQHGSRGAANCCCRTSKPTLASCCGAVTQPNVTAVKQRQAVCVGLMRWKLSNVVLQRRQTPKNVRNTHSVSHTVIGDV
jgi:hypothetical protein